MRRLQQCAKNRIKVVESQLPGPLPAKPQIADAEAAFASAGLKTPDAVEDCLVCWDFMTTFRAAAASSLNLTPSTRVVSIRRGRGWSLRRFRAVSRRSAVPRLARETRRLSRSASTPSTRQRDTIDATTSQVIRHQIRTEYKVQFPYLYTSRPRAVALAPYHHPPLYYVKPDDPDLPAFYFDPVVNPISAFRSKAVKVDDDSEDDFSVMGLEPLLSERPLYTDATAGGIALYFAPRPFNLRRGRTRRAFDVPLVNAWFKERSVTQRPFPNVSELQLWEDGVSTISRRRDAVDVSAPRRCPADHPVKVRVSYQKLLKCWVLNELHKKRPKALNRKHLFRSLKATKFFQSTELDWVEVGLQVSRGVLS